MTNSTDNQNYVRAVLAGIGIDFDETEMFISVSHCQSDEVSFTCSISASELRESAGHYVDTLNDTQLAGLDADALKKRLVYFLEVFDLVSGQYLDISGKHFATSRFEYWICPYISRHLLSLNPLQARCRRYSRGER
ncbi:hypothetical protein VEE61_47340 (plasmid) [Escherichia coli]|uniref:hypothetical protein n=1 Tax=Escherichia coli TaxID=562 RepID=UPI002B2C4EB0|nr:hypothetical protein VEE61_47340 [Escherichia coli]